MPVYFLFIPFLQEEQLTLPLRSKPLYIFKPSSVCMRHFDVIFATCVTRYDAIGRRRDKFMSFDKGEEIDIVDNSDPDWWEVRNC